jgi:hypothetical protein
MSEAKGENKAVQKFRPKRHFITEEEYKKQLEKLDREIRLSTPMGIIEQAEMDYAESWDGTGFPPMPLGPPPPFSDEVLIKAGVMIDVQAKDKKTTSKKKKR